MGPSMVGQVPLKGVGMFTFLYVFKRDVFCELHYSWMDPADLLSRSRDRRVFSGT